MVGINVFETETRSVPVASLPFSRMSLCQEGTLSFPTLRSVWRWTSKPCDHSSPHSPSLLQVVYVCNSGESVHYKLGSFTCLVLGHTETESRWQVGLRTKLHDIETVSTVEYRLYYSMYPPPPSPFPFPHTHTHTR